MTRSLLALGVVLAACGAGCNRAPPPQADPTRLAALEQRMRAAENEAASVRTQLDEARMDLEGLRERMRSANSAIFDPADRTYRRLETRFWTFAVGVRGVEAGPQGASLVIDVGNLTTASAEGVELFVRYGARFPQGESPDQRTRHAQWEDSLKRTSVRQAGGLAPGIWTTITLPLPGISPAQLGHLEILMTAETPGLRRPAAR